VGQRGGDDIPNSDLTQNDVGIGAVPHHVAYAWRSGLPEKEPTCPHQTLMAIQTKRRSTRENTPTGPARRAANVLGVDDHLAQPGVAGAGRMVR
jgi:hypothetical protein